MTPEIHAMAILIGRWFRDLLKRDPTQGEIDIVMRELAELPQPCTRAQVATAMQRAAAHMGVMVPARFGG